MKLFKTFNLGPYELQNRIVMAPMTRSRAIGNVPNSLMAEYYAQRADAGLIITEGTSPSPNGLGYARIPGIFSPAQVEGWKGVTQAVHQKGARIFVQLMHTGRVGHVLNLPEGAEVMAPSALALEGNMYTDAEGPQPYPVPRKMTLEDIEKTEEEYVLAAKNAIEAGFDGVELHGANGYLIEQFIHPNSNQRTDDYGGNYKNRNRFALEVAEKIAVAIGPHRVGIRLSPYGANGGMGNFEQIEESFSHLAYGLGQLKIAYIHLVDHAALGAPTVPDSVKNKIKKAFGGTIIISGGFDKKKAEAALKAGKGDLVAFGRPFISNPDLVARMDKDLPLSSPDFAKFYTPGPEGYTDYPVASLAESAE
ncbi:MAG: alkene reductase [Bacteroidia bacterium]|nr:alkene reductase [Bacteroidia bacterium]